MPLVLSKRARHAAVLANQLYQFIIAHICTTTVEHIKPVHQPEFRTIHRMHREAQVPVVGHRGDMGIALLESGALEEVLKH